MARWYSPSGLGPPTIRASEFMLKNHGASGSTSKESSEHSAVTRPRARSPSRSSSSVSDSVVTMVVMSSSIWRTNDQASRDFAPAPASTSVMSLPRSVVPP